MMKIHKSKVGPLLFSFINISLTVPIVLLATKEDTWPVILLLLLLLAFVNYSLLSIRYIIKDDFLLVKSGFLYSIKIEVQKIKKIEKSNSPLSSPAASMDRIEIIYNKWDSILISPKNKQEFIQDLLLINPDIEVHL